MTLLHFQPGSRNAPVDEPSTETEPVPDELSALWREAGRLADLGDLEQARDLLERGRELAETTGATPLVQAALVRWAAVTVELGEHDRVLDLLRPLCDDAIEAYTGFLACYQTARAFELAKAFKKALFYSRLAVGRAEGLGSTALASAWNLLGNVLLAESRESEAVRAYETALARMPETDRVKRSRVLDNLGYCRALQGRLDEATGLLHTALRDQRRHGAWRYAISTHIDLCYLHLELERPRWARRHGERALELARRAEDRDAVRNALYLLGQAYAELDDLTRAMETAQRLETEFYPEAPGTARVLLAVDCRRLVNLRA